MPSTETTIVRRCAECADPFKARYPRTCAYAVANGRRIEKVKVSKRKARQARGVSA